MTRLNAILLGIILFIIGFSFTFPLWAGKEDVLQTLSQVGEKPYDSIPQGDSIFGAPPIKIVNFSYWKQWIRSNFFWILSASNDNETWYDANQLLDIGVVWNEENTTAKITLTLDTTNAPRPLYYRFSLACNNSILQFRNETEKYNWILTLPAGNDTYETFFNWSDIIPLVKQNKVFVKTGLKTINNSNYVWFRIQSKNKIPVGTTFILDPTFGRTNQSTGSVTLDDVQAGFNCTAVTNGTGTADYMMLCLKRSSGTTYTRWKVKAAIYYTSNMTLLAGTEERTLGFTTSYVWKKFNFTTKTPITNGGLYTIFAWANNTRLGGCLIAFGTTGPTYRYSHPTHTYDGVWDSPLTTAPWNNGMVYLYCSYRVTKTAWANVHPSWYQISNRSTYEYSNLTADNSWNTYLPRWYAQIITVGNTGADQYHRFISIKMKASRVGVPGNVHVFLREVNESENPIGENLTAGIENANVWSTSTLWHELFVDPPYLLKPNRKYAICFYADGTSTSNEILFSTNMSAPYSGGGLQRSLDGGATWTKYYTDDMLFFEYGLYERWFYNSSGGWLSIENTSTNETAGKNWLLRESGWLSSQNNTGFDVRSQGWLSIENTSTLYERFNSEVDSSIAIPKGPNNLRGQMFTIGTTGPDKNHMITYVKLLLTGTGTSTNISVAIKATGIDGKPAGANLSLGSRDAIQFDTETPTWYTFNMTPCILHHGTRYAIVVCSSVAVAAYWWYPSLNNTYAGGSTCFSNDGGASWTLQSADYDFEEYGIRTRIFENQTGGWLSIENISGKAWVNRAVGWLLFQNNTSFKIRTQGWLSIQNTTAFDVRAYGWISIQNISYNRSWRIRTSGWLTAQNTTIFHTQSYGWISIQNISYNRSWRIRTSGWLTAQNITIFHTRSYGWVSVQNISYNRSWRIRTSGWLSIQNNASWAVRSYGWISIQNVSYNKSWRIRTSGWLTVQNVSSWKPRSYGWISIENISAANKTWQTRASGWVSILNISIGVNISWISPANESSLAKTAQYVFLCFNLTNSKTGNMNYTVWIGNSSMNCTVLFASATGVGNGSYYYPYINATEYDTYYWKIVVQDGSYGASQTQWFTLVQESGGHFNNAFWIFAAVAAIAAIVLLFILRTSDEDEEEE
jgi:hypothetical protein